MNTQIVGSAEISRYNRSGSIDMHTSMQIVATREAASPIQSICLAFAFQLPLMVVNGRKAIQAIVETQARIGGM